MSRLDNAGIWIDNMPNIQITADVKQLPFFSTISHKISEPLTTVSLLQAYMWQLVPTLKNILCVAPTFQSSKFFGGKTFGYLLPLIHNIIFKDKYSTYLPKYSTSPYIVILCPYSSMVEKIGKQVEEIVSTTELKSLYIYSSMDQLSREISVINGCDILIATTEIVLSLIDRKIIHLKRVCHLIFEDFTALYEFSKSQVERLFSDFQLMLNARSLEVPKQILMLCSKWTPSLQRFKNRFDSIMIISSKKECAYASRVKQIPIMCSQDKESIFKDILLNLKRVLFCTNDYESSAKLSKLLELKKIKHLMINEDIKIKYEQEKLNNFDCLIIGDNVQNFLNPINITCLIHLDIPTSANKFFNRIWYLRDYFQTKMVDDHEEIKSIILINKESHNNLTCHHIYDILERLNVELPPFLAQLAEKENNIMAKEKSLKLCDNLKSFGFCRMKQCSSRHALNESIDCSSMHQLSTLPDSGIVKVKVLKVKSPIAYFAEILSLKNANDKSVKECLTKKKKVPTATLR